MPVLFTHVSPASETIPDTEQEIHKYLLPEQMKDESTINQTKGRTMASFKGRQALYFKCQTLTTINYGIPPLKCVKKSKLKLLPNIYSPF